MAGSPARWKTLTVFVGLVLGMLLAALDQTIIGTAMPRIVANLGSLTYYSWIFSIYMLTSTATVPVFGKLSDIYGRRWFYIFGLMVFLAGSALSGAAQTMVQLIAFRGLQGIGAGALMPIAVAIIGDIVAPRERSKFQALISAIWAIGSMIGPAAGGFIVDNLNWRWVFYINLPVGLVIIIVMFFNLRDRPVQRIKQSIDYFGVATLVPAITTMLLTMIWGGTEYEWTSPTTMALGTASLVLWVLFILAEKSASEPIIPFSLFRNSIFTVSAITVFLSGVGMFGTIMFIPLFVQSVIGSTATSSGLVLTPLTSSLIAASIVSGQMISRTGRYRNLGLCGLALLAGGACLMYSMDATTTSESVVRNMIVIGTGLGLTMPVFIIAVQNSVERAQLGVATSALHFFRSVGGTIGVAVMGTLLAYRLNFEMDERVASLPQEAWNSLGGAGLKEFYSTQSQMALAMPAGVPRVIAELMKGAMAASIQEVFFVAFVLTVLSLISCWFLKEIPLRRRWRHSANDILSPSDPGSITDVEGGRDGE